MWQTFRERTLQAFGGNEFDVEHTGFLEKQRCFERGARLVVWC